MRHCICLQSGIGVQRKVRAMTVDQQAGNMVLEKNKLQARWVQTYHRGYTHSAMALPFQYTQAMP